MNCPVCQKPLENHSIFDANVCATALDQRVDHVRSKCNEQVSGWEAAARVLRRRIIVMDREQSFT